MVLERTLESPLDFKDIQLVHPKEDQSWVFIGRSDVEAETAILWPPDAKSWLTGKDPDAGKDWGQEEKGTTEDEMVGWHHQLNGHEFGWTLGVGDGQGGLACCSSWGHKELDMTEWLNWTELNMWDLSSLTRDWTFATCTGITKSQPLDHQGSPTVPTSKITFFLYTNDDEPQLIQMEKLKMQKTGQWNWGPQLWWGIGLGGRGSLSLVREGKGEGKS